jgi:hypothetical protein
VAEASWLGTEDRRQKPSPPLWFRAEPLYQTALTKKVVALPRAALGPGRNRGGRGGGHALS